MTRTEFTAYIGDYNSHDTARLFRHYDPDLVFENFGFNQRGPDAFGFLGSLYQIVADTLEVQQILIDGDAVAMEAISTITALRDAPDLPIGPMRSGEQVTMRMFAFYRTSGPIITHIKVAGWPPVGVTAAPSSPHR
jgi:hypothetical protein